MVAAWPFGKKSKSDKASEKTGSSNQAESFNIDSPINIDTPINTDSPINKTNLTNTKSDAQPSSQSSSKLDKATAAATVQIIESKSDEPSENPTGEQTDSSSFYIDLRPKLIKLKQFTDKTLIDIRYPLMPPFAYAHIYWDDDGKELIYKVEEPILDDAEKEVLGLIQLALEEMINVSFIRATKSNLIMQYLEGNVKSILVELGLELTNESYQKIMYAVYRDSVGLNEIEPLLNDYFIEDIECNGINFPLYVVHRKYDTLKTNIMFSDMQRATDFVEKLAQRCGRYVSYAKPLLDGTLPDGSRVNATYTEDVTTRGPTFTIRKFTKEPWTPIHLIKQGTASAEVFAYLWLAMEYKSNIIVIGETGSGKTTFLNALAYFIPPQERICSIEDTRELNLTHDNWLPSVTRTGFGIPNILGEQYGEITLFDLLKETFRQNPDYVILGETRGKETYVLFQGMASGHPSLCTFHAASVETLVRRLETPPINLPASLIESIDLVLSITHAKDLKGEEKNLRRLKEVAEIISVKQELGRVEYGKFFQWDPISDDMMRSHEKSILMDKISRRTGMSIEDIEKEVQLRRKVIEKLLEKDLLNFEEFSRLVNTYYKQKDVVMKNLGITE